jgi:hypothetical protein
MRSEPLDSTGLFSMAIDICWGSLSFQFLQRITIYVEYQWDYSWWNRAATTGGVAFDHHLSHAPQGGRAESLSGQGTEEPPGDPDHRRDVGSPARAVVRGSMPPVQEGDLIDGDGVICATAASGRWRKASVVCFPFSDDAVVDCAALGVSNRPSQ